MNRDYKKILEVIGVALFLIFLTSFQVAFINLSLLNLNLFLILILYLVLTGNNLKALVFAWLSGILTGFSYFSNFGINSLILLVLTAILIILYKKFLTLETEGIVLISVIGVTLYHFLNWLMTNREGFYFASREILIELILTPLVLLIIFKIKTQNAQKFT